VARECVLLLRLVKPDAITVVGVEVPPAPSSSTAMSLEFTEGRVIVGVV
jgi:hypothetical protein